MFSYAVLTHNSFFYKRLHVKRFVKFAITGGIGFVLDFILTWFFKEKLGLNPYVANGVGFSAAVINNFYLNKYWTFSRKGGSVGVQFSYFICFSVIGLILNTFLLFFFTNYLHLNFYIGKCMAIALVFIWNYSVNSFVTFKNQSISHKDEYQNT